MVTAVFLSFQPALEDQTHRVITGARALVCTHPRDSAYATPVSTGLPASSAGLGDLGLTVSVCGLLPLLVCLPLYVPCPHPCHPRDLGVVDFLFSHPLARYIFSLPGCSALKEPHFYN